MNKILIRADSHDEADILTAQLVLAGFSEAAIVTARSNETIDDSTLAGIAIVIDAGGEADHGRGRVLADHPPPFDVPVLLLAHTEDTCAGGTSHPRPLASMASMIEEVARRVPRQQAETRPPTRDEELLRYRDLFDRASDAILILDYCTHEILEANQRAVNLYGYSHDDLIGRSMLELVPREQHPAMLRNTRRLKESRATINVDDRVHIRKDGSRVNVGISAALIEYGGRLVFHDIIRDDTERRALLSSLSEKNESLERVNAELKSEVEQRRQAENDLRKLALYDSVTGLPSRRLFVDNLRRAIRANHRRDLRVAVIYIDLDDFKLVNDTFGHVAGDELLKAVGARLEAALRASDMVSRIGGDEFCVLIDDVGSLAALKRTVDKIHASFQEPVQIEGSDQPITASIGAAASMSASQSAEQLINSADQKMYSSKRAGKNQCTIPDSLDAFDDTVSAVSTKRGRRDG